MVPVRDLDYTPDRIRLRVSSSKIGLRLHSVEKEPFTVGWIEQSIRPGDVFYDIGANVGAYALIAAKATDGRAAIFAFEPSPSSFAELSRNILLNNSADCIVPVPLALWSETGPLFFAPASLEAGASQHRIGGSPDEEPSNETIVGVSLDDLQEHFHLPAPNYLKIDVDGNELEVLRGAAQTIARRDLQSIILELDPRESDRNRAVTLLLTDAGLDPVQRFQRPANLRRPNPKESQVAYWIFNRTRDSPGRGGRRL